MDMQTGEKIEAMIRAGQPDDAICRILGVTTSQVRITRRRVGDFTRYNSGYGDDVLSFRQKLARADQLFKRAIGERRFDER